MARHYDERAHWPDVRDAIRRYRAGDRTMNFCQAIERYEMLPPATWPGAAALDVCCGSGQGALILKDKGYAVVAVDKDPVAGALLTAEGIMFAHADAMTVTPGFNFELITCSEGLEHVADPRALLARMVSWVAPGGRLFLTVPCEGAASPNPYHCNSWTAAQLRALIEEHWRIVEVHKPSVSASLWCTCEPRARRLATLSFDDGGSEDPYVMDALRREGIPATFYLVAGWMDREHFGCDDKDIPALYDGFEIGCHSWTHPDFRNLAPADLARETTEAARYLEQAFGRAVTLFAWPYGAVADGCKPELAKRFAAARAIHRNDFDPSRPADLMAAGITGVFEPACWQARGGLPTIHFFTHSYAIGERLMALMDMCRFIRAAGFTFVTNSEFYRQ